jgi:hypothetical protein
VLAPSGPWQPAAASTAVITTATAVMITATATAVVIVADAVVNKLDRN